MQQKAKNAKKGQKCNKRSLLRKNDKTWIKPLNDTPVDPIDSVCFSHFSQGHIFAAESFEIV